MIASVQGKVEATGIDFVVVNVQGIGIKVLTTPATISVLSTAGDAQLQTELVVREDSMTLYGFESVAERETFVALMGVSGIGPRTALAALAVLSPGELRTAVEEEDLTTLQRIPGVGKKSASRMLLEMNGKLAKIDAVAVPGTNSVRAEVEGALEQLGWPKAQASAVLDNLSSQAETNIELADASSLLRAALQQLGASRV